MSWPRRIIIVAFLIFAGLAAGIVYTRVQALASPEQPLDYSHRTHVGSGIQCLYCHTNATRSEIAGIPSVQKCMGCHRVIAVDDPEVQKLAGYWEREEPIPWVRVEDQPDFVYFSHLPHLGAGANCETCHGDVGQMATARPVVEMDMGWCLDCHLKQPEEKIARLTDCIACHK